MDIYVETINLAKGKKRRVENGMAHPMILEGKTKYW